jgi:hypothetical protein
MAEIHGKQTMSETSRALMINPPVGWVLLVCYDARSGELTYVDPIPKHKRP